jgi:S-layer protein (TIGR01567 family)
VKDGTVTIELDDEDISLSSDGVTDVLEDRIAVRINEHDDYAAVVKTITEPGTYEFMGEVGGLEELITLNSSENPSILWYDIDDKVGNEYVELFIDDDLEIKDGNFTYNTTTYYTTDSELEQIAWMGSSYAVVVNETSEMWISEYLVDEEDDDDYLLAVGESMSLPDGFSITADQIDVEGDKAMFTISQNGEALDSEVVDTKAVPSSPYFVYETDLDDDGDDDDTVMNFTVDTVFAGMNSNMVKIKNIDLISLDPIEIKNNDDDLFNDFIVRVEAGTVRIELDDEDISLSSDGITDIFADRISVRINEHDNYAAVVKTITEPGTYELMGAVGNVSGWLNLTSEKNPSILWFDIDEKEGKEAVEMYIDSDLDIKEGKFNYTTTTYTTNDSDLEQIAWMGSSYAVVVNETSEMWISEYLVDEENDDDYLLAVGESMSLPDGFSITADQIDVEGDKAMFTISQNGEALDSEVVDTKAVPSSPYFVYETDLDDDGDDDDTVMNFTVDTVFAGMNSNMVKIKNIDLISLDPIEIKNNDDDLFNDFIVRVEAGTVRIELDDEDISLSSDGITDIFADRIAVRINDKDDYAAVVKEIIIGGVPTPTETATVVGTEEPTEPTTNVTADGTVDGTAAPTADVVETEVPTPTPEPGFEAVFAVAGLLAVAYLVLRQRE